eukprot:gene2461-4780_t
MNATTMLFPGGAKEACHNKGEEYKLFWPEKPEFVRMASIFDAIIVPFAAVGIYDSVNFVMGPDEMLDIPFIGDRLRSANSALPQARPGVEENLGFPLLTPKLPSRVYFLFQQPFDTADLNTYDKKAAKAMYEDIQRSVTDGIDTLLKFREGDPYMDFIPRTAYEALSGNQAPTAPLNMKTIT